jgi:hypothetical protein
MVNGNLLSESRWHRELKDRMGPVIHSDIRVEENGIKVSRGVGSVAKWCMPVHAETVGCMPVHAQTRSGACRCIGYAPDFCRCLPVHAENCPGACRGCQRNERVQGGACHVPACTSMHGPKKARSMTRPAPRTHYLTAG